MTVVEAPSIAVNLYASYLKQANSPDTTPKNTKTNRFFAIFDKIYQPSSNKNYSPLTLREITLLGIQIKDDIIKSPEKAQLVSNELQLMVEKKKIQEAQRFTFTRVFSYVGDCFSNYWGGFGFKPTEALIEELSRDLAKQRMGDAPIHILPPQSAPINIPPPRNLSITNLPKLASSFEKSSSPIESPEIPSENSPSPSPETYTLLQRKTTKGKKRALEAYKNNPNSCYHILKSMIFRDIRKIQSPNSQEFSLVQLMEYVSDQPYNLHNELCGQVVLDTMKECDIHTIDQMCDWLITEVTFNPTLLSKCLRILLEKEKSRKVVSLFTIESLFKVYSVNSWNRFISVNHPDIIESMALLLRVSPNSTPTGVFTEWIIRQPEFSFEGFIILIRVFKDKESSIDLNNLFYPACNTLLAHLDQNAAWKELLFSNQNQQDLANYIRRKGVYASKEDQIEFEAQNIEKVQTPEQTFSPRRETSLKEPSRTTPQLKRTNTVGKIRALELYKKSPQNCQQGPKNIIFKDIKHIEPPFGLVSNNEEVISIVHLMKYMTNSEKIDLNDPMCSQIVMDTFKICNKETSDRLSEWLIEQPTFNVNLLVNCLELLVEKDVFNIPISHFAVEMLLKKYKQESWNLQTSATDAQVFIPKFYAIISAVIVVLKNNPNNENIEQFILWLMDQPEFDSSSFCILLLVFRNKEKEIGIGKVHYPCRDQMIDRLHSKPASHWAKELVTDSSKTAQDAIDYMISIG